MYTKYICTFEKTVLLILFGYTVEYLFIPKIKETHNRKRFNFDFL